MPKDKSVLRKEALLMLKKAAFPDPRAIETAVCSRTEYISAKNLFAFFPLKTEPDVTSVIGRALNDGKAVFLPVCAEGRKMKFAKVEGKNWREKLVRSSNGTMCPESPEFADLDSLGKTLILVPGLLFDKSLRRLGRGGGFYDFFLSSIKNDRRFARLGICISSQLEDELPFDPWDEKLDGLVVC